MDFRIPLFKIYWDEEDIANINNTIRKGMYWTVGNNTTVFEEMISKYVGTKYCVVFNSGTSALHAILLSYGIGPGDEVIVPSFTFIATANAAFFVGATPVFADIEDQTYGLDPDDVKRKITTRTKAIIPIHYGGSPCLVKELRKIADDHNVLLVEDAAEAFGASIGQKMVGTFGHSAILSFCQNKIITTGEGGAVITNTKEVYEKLKLIRSHGRLDTADYFASSEYADYITLGYNFRLSDISAALGIAQLNKVEKIIAMRRKNAALMNQTISKIDQLFTPKIPDNYHHVYQMFTIRMKGDNTDRDELISYLGSKGIMSKVNFYPVHLTKFYQEKFGHQPVKLPLTEKVSKQTLTLPMYPTLSEEEIEYIGRQLDNFFSSQRKH
jgi:perosamine synthetase